MIKFLEILKIPFVGVISTHKILPGLINVIQTQDDFCNFYDTYNNYYFVYPLIFHFLFLSLLSFISLFFSFFFLFFFFYLLILAIFDFINNQRHEICDLGIKSYNQLLHKNKTGNVIFI